MMLVASLLNCRSSADPLPEAVKSSAEALFERAAKGEKTPVEIPFTGQGSAVPKLLRSDLVARRKLSFTRGEAFEYDVKLSYLNRIAQMEDTVVTVRFEKPQGIWLPTFIPRKTPSP